MHHNHHVHHTSLSDYNWYELFPPSIYVLAIILAFVYFRFVAKDKQGKKLATKWQQTSMIASLLLMIIIKGTPVQVLGHNYLFSVHMVQMAVLYLMIAPLMILGIPEVRWKSWLSKKTILTRIFHFLTKPLLALLIFNAVFSLYHIPLVFDAAVSNPVIHYGYHALLLITAYTMWWPVLCPVRELDTLSDIKKIGYVFANGVLMTPACALIMFADFQLYETYRNVPQLFETMTPKEDQHVGGVTMKIFQEVIYAFVLGLIFTRWVKKERLRDKADLELIKRQNNQLKPELK
ncbi:cytochrome c oxidase assembly protein [Fictibacillus sp. 5RED26]|uniref:cytochrome c oxidase assembly protein n=1 Tax=unclassified Fictibacillus TaxID=2644029 RepID=UPI0018CF3138|nr:MULTISPECIES: cytochrome c oxidase assembly protein [unclassified Fictibacillus]MBH0155750.1 cytochrome c oxidase assembly protein [Fictibacillus sp. 5RED26]MBH0172943.1 cytochrome c oxidase assembly protein [Fictibacillus sp. 23RED33]